MAYLQIIGPANEILALIAHTQKPSINAHADVSCYARDIYFGLRFHLHLYICCKHQVLIKLLRHSVMLAVAVTASKTGKVGSNIADTKHDSQVLAAILLRQRWSSQQQYNCITMIDLAAI